MSDHIHPAKAIIPVKCSVSMQILEGYIEAFFDPSAKTMRHIRESIMEGPLASLFAEEDSAPKQVGHRMTGGAEADLVTLSDGDLRDSSRVASLQKLGTVSSPHSKKAQSKNQLPNSAVIECNNSESYVLWFPAD